MIKVDLSEHPATKSIMESENVAHRRYPNAFPQRIIISLFTVLFFALLVSLTLLSNIIQIVVFPFRYASPEAVYYMNAFMAGKLWLLCNWIYFNLNGAKFSKSGLDEVPAKENAIVISNHCYFGDFFLLHLLASEKMMLSFCKYFAKDSVKYIPIFGWGIYMMGNLLVKRDWNRDRSRIDNTFRLFLKHKLPVWIVSYVEGTRFTNAKLQASHLHAEKNHLPKLNNVLLPRTKGFVAALNAFRNSGKIEHVYDCTLIYYHKHRGFGATPSFWDICFGNLGDYNCHIHVDRIAISSIPKTDEEAANWLIQRYVHKDQLIQFLKSNIIH